MQRFREDGRARKAAPCAAPLRFMQGASFQNTSSSRQALNLEPGFNRRKSGEHERWASLPDQKRSWTRRGSPEHDTQQHRVKALVPRFAPITPIWRSFTGTPSPAGPDCLAAGCYNIIKESSAQETMRHDPKGVSVKSDRSCGGNPYSVEAFSERRGASCPALSIEI